jgi:hypothetical protein
MNKKEGRLANRSADVAVFHRSPTNRMYYDFLRSTDGTTWALFRAATRPLPHRGTTWRRRHGCGLPRL